MSAAQEIHSFQMDIEGFATVELVVGGPSPCYFEYVLAETPASKIIEHYGRLVGYGGGGYLTWKDCSVDLSHTLASGEVYVYHMSMEQFEKRKIVLLTKEIEEAKLRALNATEVTVLANQRSAMLNEETCFIKNSRAQKLGDLNQQWAAFHDAADRTKRSVSFHEQYDSPY